MTDLVGASTQAAILSQKHLCAGGSCSERRPSTCSVDGEKA
jgi:hypothetical protein